MALVRKVIALVSGALVLSPVLTMAQPITGNLRAENALKELSGIGSTARANIGATSPIIAGYSNPQNQTTLATGNSIGAATGVYTIAAGSRTLHTNNSFFGASKVGDTVAAAGAGLTLSSGWVSSIPIATPGSYPAAAGPVLATVTDSTGAGQNAVYQGLFGLNAATITSGGVSCPNGTYNMALGTTTAQTSGLVYSGAVINVTVSGGVVTTANSITPGSYAIVPPAASVSGTGCGTQPVFAFTWGLNSFLVLSGGEFYSTGAGNVTATLPSVGGATNATLGTPVVTPTVLPLYSKIASIQDVRDVTLVDPAQTTLTDCTPGCTWPISSDQIVAGDQRGAFWTGTDDGAALRAAMATNLEVYLPPGNYTVGPGNVTSIAITGTLTPGDVVTVNVLAYGGPSLATPWSSVLRPESYTIQSGDTALLVAQGLAGVINADTFLATSSITATGAAAPDGSNLFDVTITNAGTLQAEYYTQDGLGGSFNESLIPDTNALPMPNNGKISGSNHMGATLTLLPGAFSHLLGNANLTAQQNIVQSLQLNGNNSLQINDFNRSPEFLTRCDYSGGSASVLPRMRILDTIAFASNGTGYYFGGFCRDAQMLGWAAYKNRLHGLEADNADSTIGQGDVGQSGSDGIFTKSSHTAIFGVRSWFSGRVDGVGNGLFCRSCNQLTGSLITQSNMGNGALFFASSGTITGVDMDIYSDSDNVSGSASTPSALNLNGVSNGQFRVQSTNVPLEQGYIRSAVDIVNATGTIIDITANNGVSFVVGGSWSGNNIRLNGTQTLASVTFPGGGTYTPSPFANAFVEIPLGANLTIANPSISGTPTGITQSFILLQDATGGRTITWGTLYKKSCSLTTTASTYTSISFVYDGTNWIQSGGCVTGAA